MDHITVGELRAQSGAIWQRIEAGEGIVVTRYGKPFAVLLPTKPTEVETTLRTYRAGRFGQVLTQLQVQARASGASKLSQKDIDAEVAAARREALTQASANKSRGPARAARSGR